ncbi:hypothetical protein NDU88_003939 [Pleurodeles waltl]|uniref:Uncharacterized protein n=1 Tax=Pleurodeles waltl TaxID=8319 RepID=A0AAV7QAF1_PLEWA|nr:hypothetical protein NDU88_003939 [Pleurodeles waltl]
MTGPPVGAGLLLLRYLPGPKLPRLFSLAGSPFYPALPEAGVLHLNFAVVLPRRAEARQGNAVWSTRSPGALGLSPLFWISNAISQVQDRVPLPTAVPTAPKCPQLLVPSAILPGMLRRVPLPPGSG